MSGRAKELLSIYAKPVVVVVLQAGVLSSQLSSENLLDSEIKKGERQSSC